jgi:hypothetical protein
VSFQCRRRWLFLAGVILLHVVIFFIIRNIIIFRAPAPDETTESFIQVSLPKPVAPPADVPPPSSADMANLTPPVTTVPVVVAPPQVITSMNSSSFTLPKVEMPKLPDINVPTPTQTSSSVTDPGASGSTANGNGNGGDGTTASKSDMQAALGGDTREGEIVGVIPNDATNRVHLVDIDELIQKDITRIGIFVDHPSDGYSAGIKHGYEVPSMAKHPQWFKGNNTEAYNVLEFQNVIDLPKVKTIVLFMNFDDPFNGDTRYACDKFVTKLRNKNIRLCIVSYGAAPYPPLADYVRESGGTIYYPKGLP